MSNRPDYDDPIPQSTGLYIGVVVDRDDPENLGRVRVRIPGLIEPASNWAWPLGASGGGTEDQGFWNIPPLDSEVGIFFKLGDTDHPYYMAANWGAGEPPTASDSGDPDVKVIALKEYDVVIDNREASKGFKIVDKSANDNIIEFDGVSRTLKLSSTTSIEISSTGQVSIDGLVVTINGITAGLGQL